MKWGYCCNSFSELLKLSHCKNCSVSQPRLDLLPITGLLIACAGPGLAPQKPRNLQSASPLSGGRSSGLFRSIFSPSTQGKAVRAAEFERGPGTECASPHSGTDLSVPESPDGLCQAISPKSLPFYPLKFYCFWTSLPCRAVTAPAFTTSTSERLPTEEITFFRRKICCPFLFVLHHEVSLELQMEKCD